MTILLIVLVILIVSAAIPALIYNLLVKLKNRVDAAWSQIDVQLQRRFDLIPNLVETVKGYAAHEQETLGRVTEARAMMARGGGPKEKAAANNMLEDALKSLFAVTENYPYLKADKNFLMLQEELSATENKIAFARQHYNDSVMMFNTKIETFPNNILANLFGFKPREYFEIPEEARGAVKVEF